MNPRIRNIAVATDVWCDRYYSGKDSYDTEWEQKFAQLIATECRTVINDLYHKTPLELCGPLLTADEEIAKHFYGVEP